MLSVTVVTAKLAVNVAAGSPIAPAARVLRASHLEDKQGAWTRSGERAAMTRYTEAFRQSIDDPVGF
jgi:hypothetical protein